jgi:uncharacterized membrane protein YgcG
MATCQRCSVSPEMFAARRSRTVLAIGIAAAVLAGCGTSSTSSGVPDSKIIAALDMKKVQGRYAIDANPFCSVSQVLNSADQVDKAKSSHRVIASRDATVGIEIVKPFAPSCQKQAQRKLNRLAGLRRHRHHRHKKKGKHGKAAGHGGKHHHRKSKNGGGGSNGG